MPTIPPPRFYFRVGLFPVSGNVSHVETQHCSSDGGGCSSGSNSDEPHVRRRIVAASDATWRIDMNCAFPGPTATRCCSCFYHASAHLCGFLSIQFTFLVSLEILFMISLFRYYFFSIFGLPAISYLWRGEHVWSTPFTLIVLSGNSTPSL